MIRSMTGYGQGSAEMPGFSACVDIRSVNHRYVDLRLRMPAGLQANEKAIRKQVLACVSRGRVEVGISIERTEDRAPVPVLNRNLVEAAVSAAGELKEEYGIAGTLDLRTILSLPAVFQESTTTEELTDGEYEVVERALEAGLKALDDDRAREGSTLRDDSITRLQAMKEYTTTIARKAGLVPEMAKQKLEKKLEKLADGIDLDPARVAQEVAILADRCDITEELVRLESHIDQAAGILASADGEPVGKRLDFLLQEINRETNTINSKSSDLEISREALRLKSETEKVREQIQNLE